MKKLLCLLLVVLLLSLSLTACGGMTDQPVTSSAIGANPFPDELNEVEALPIKSLALDNTTWVFSGGMYRGVEMNEDDARTFLEGCGGSCVFAFGEHNKVTATMGENTETAPYSVISDGYFLEINFRASDYYGVFTLQEEYVVMILSNTVEPDVILYMILVEE